MSEFVEFKVIANEFNDLKKGETFMANQKHEGEFKSKGLAVRVIVEQSKETKEAPVKKDTKTNKKK